MLTSEALRRAADLSDEIAAKQAELDQILAGKEVDSPAARTVRTTTGVVRRFSPESIEKIRAAQKRRWKNARKAAAAAQAAATSPQVAAPTEAPAVAQAETAKAEPVAA